MAWAPAPAVLSKASQVRTSSRSELYSPISKLYADWVRLRSGFEPPHWHPGGSRWDAGYQVTGYFLQWLTERYGEGTVPEINELMKDAAYDELIFKTTTGRKVSKLWKLYKEHLGEGDGDDVS